MTSHHRRSQVICNLGSVSKCGKAKHVTRDPALTLVQTLTPNHIAGELKPPRVLRAERTALERQLITDIVDGERFGTQVARLCDAFGTAQKKMIAGADHHVTIRRGLMWSLIQGYQPLPTASGAAQPSVMSACYSAVLGHN